MSRNYAQPPRAGELASWARSRWRGIWPKLLEPFSQCRELHVKSIALTNAGCYLRGYIQHCGGTQRKQMLRDKEPSVPAGRPVESDLAKPAEHRMQETRFHHAIKIVVLHAEGDSPARLELFLREQSGCRCGDLFQIAHCLAAIPCIIFIHHP